MEDFGYQKNYDGNDKLRSVAKRIFLSLAALFSVAAFIYVTISAYHYVYEDISSDIVTIKSPENPIKVIAKEDHKETSMQIDRKIYEDIFGNKKSSRNSRKAKVKNAPEPAIPPKKERRKIVKNSNKTRSNNQKIIVFSDAKKQSKARGAKKDLLTKIDGEKRDNTAAPAKRHSGRKAKVRVQVAAMSSKQAAEKAFKSLNRIYPTLFSDLGPFIKRVNLGKRGVFYRLQIGNFFNQIEAESFCRRYVAAAKKSKADCIVVE